MQIKNVHNIPNYIPPPIRPSPPVQKAPSLPPTKPHAISISAPNTNTNTNSRVAVPIPPTIEPDDSSAAYYDYQFLFFSQRSEATQPVALSTVDGVVPADFPAGTYYLTGPGVLSDDHGSTVHPLDGHGYLRAFTFDNVTKNVKYMAKYIKTEAHVEEHDPNTKKWKFTHRGPFSVLKGGRKVGNTKVMKNVANTSVLKWGEKLLCMWEGGEPYQIQTGTLDTIGRYNMMDGADSLQNHDHNHSRDLWEVAATLLKPILYGIFHSYILSNTYIPHLFFLLIIEQIHIK